MTPVLVVQLLSVRYGRQPVFHGVTFDVAAGQCLGVIGPNGAGKTTLLRTVVGLAQYAGGVRINGVEPRRAVSRMGIAYFAGEATLPGFHVPVPGAHSAERRGRPGWATVRALSRGTRQLVGLRTVLGRQSLTMVVLDEPWEALDPDGARWLSAIRTEARPWGGRGAGVAPFSGPCRVVRCLSVSVAEGIDLAAGASGGLNWSRDPRTPDGGVRQTSRRESVAQGTSVTVSRLPDRGCAIERLGRIFPVRSPGARRVWAPCRSSAVAAPSRSAADQSSEPPDTGEWATSMVQKCDLAHLRPAKYRGSHWMHQRKKRRTVQHLKVCQGGAGTCPSERSHWCSSKIHAALTGSGLSNRIQSPELRTLGTTDCVGRQVAAVQPAGAIAMGRLLPSRHSLHSKRLRVGIEVVEVVVAVRSSPDAPLISGAALVLVA